MILKRIIVTILCAIATKIAGAQIKFPSHTIQMYTRDSVLHSFNDNLLLDTLIGNNETGCYEEHALVLKNKLGKTIDVLSMCRNRTTPNSIKLIRIGDNLFRIGNRYIVKINNRTLKAFAKSFERPRHCDHASHSSHYSSISL